MSISRRGLHLRQSGHGWRLLVLALMAAVIVAPAFVPTRSLAAGPDDPTFNVQTGGIRQGNSTTIAPLPAGAVFTASNITGAAASDTCTTIGTNPCTISFTAAGAGRQYAVRETTAPSGWYLNPNLATGTGGSNVTSRPYQFRTAMNVASGATVNVPGTGNTNNDTVGTGTNNYPQQTFSAQLGGASLADPAALDVCGLKLAMVLDQSTSMTAPRQTILKEAATATISALEGTPSTLSLYTFGTGADPDGQVIDAPTNTDAGIAELQAFVNDLPAQAPTNQFTNYDAGLAQTLGENYNQIVFMTDGAPTASRLRPNGDAAVSSFFTDTEQGMFTANEIKSQGTRIVGVGLDLGTSGGVTNLRAVSGAVANEDYFSTTDADFEDAIRNAAAGSCLNRLTIRKQIQNADGTLVTPDPTDTNGWDFANTISSGELDSPVTTAPGGELGENGYAEAAVTIAAGATPTVTVAETLKAGYTFASAHCTVDGANVTTTVTGATSATPTASFTAQADAALLCTFVNRRTPVTPTITTQPTATAPVGGQLSDTATVSGPASPPGLPTPTGTVTFRLYPTGTCTPGTELVTSAAIPLVNGSAASGPVTASAPPGPRFWQVTYDPAGDANFLTATSGCLDEPVTITPAQPAMHTTQSPASATAGTAISDSATVTGGANPTGTVTFLLFGPDNPNCSPTPGPIFSQTVPLVNGTATLPPNAVITNQAGTFRWAAIYHGDANNAIVSTACQDEPVQVAPATATLTTQASAGGVVGVGVSDHATLTPPAPGLVAPTGTVTFRLYGPQADPAAPDCTGTPVHEVTVPVAGDGARTPLPDFEPSTAGTYEWVVTYSGDANFQPAGPTRCGAEPIPIGQDQPDDVITQPSGNGVAGSDTPAVTDLATVTGGTNPTGTITFELFGPQADEANPTCTGTPVFSATVDLTGTPPSATSPAVSPAPTQAGAYEWVATYSGDDNNAPFSSACGDEPIEITRATPAIQTNENPAGTVTVGTSLSDSATVTGGVMPTGTVTFVLFGPENPTCDPLISDPIFVEDLPLVNGQAGPTTPFPSAITGTVSWVAVYSGDDNNTTVTSPCTSEQVTIDAATPAIATTQSATSVTVGTAISDTVTLTGGFQPITGTVTFTLFGPGDTTCTTPITTFANVPLVGATGMATSPSFTVTTVGTYHWVATFNGDGNNVSVTSGCTDEPVAVAPATPTIATTPRVANPLGQPIGSQISDTATVTGGFTPSGSVTFTLFAPGDTTCTTPVFTSGPITLSGNPLTASSGSFTANQLGTYHWVATFTPADANNVPATSHCAAEPVIIVPATPDVATNVSPEGPVGTVLSDTATVTGGFNPTGTVTFHLFAPGDTTCANAPIFTSANRPLANGTATSESFTTTAAGEYRWTAVYNGDGNNNAISSTCQDEPIFVGATTPGIATHPTPTGTVDVGSTIQDSVTLTGVSGAPAPRGTVTFELFGPDDFTCTTTPVVTISEVTLTATSPAPDPPTSTASSGPIPAPGPAGSYEWEVAFTPANDEANFEPVESGCGLEPVDVGVATPGITTDPTPSGTVAVGDTIQDSATLTGVTGEAAPSGTATFLLFGPNDPTCSNPPVVTVSDTALTQTSPAPDPPTSTASSGPVTAPGPAGTYEWVVEFTPAAGETSFGAVVSECGEEPVDVGVATPGISTEPTPTGTAPVGSHIQDRATVTGVAGEAAPRGTVTFLLFGPDDPTCSNPPVVTVSDVALTATSPAPDPPTSTAASGNVTAPAPAGTYEWVVEFTPAAGETNFGAVVSGCGEEPVDVGVATPGISTMATPTGEVAVGSPIQDTVTVTGVAGAPAPTGTVTFQLFGPDDETCSGQPVAGPLTGTLETTSGTTPPQATASVSSTAPTARGTYTWQVAYQPADNNFGARTVCGGADEQVAVGVLVPGDPTMATPTGDVRIGQPIEDTVTLTGEDGLPAPSGTVVFRLFGPDDPTCSREPALTANPEMLTEVTPATSPPTSTATVNEIAPAPPGTYTWEIEYTPDAASQDIFAARTTCGGNHEQVTIVPRQVSLSVIKSVSPNPYTPGQPLTYTITVMNGGPDTADPATVFDPFPPQLQSASFTWTCTAAGAGTSCGAASGTAPPLRDQPVITPSGSVTYVLTGTVPAGTSGAIRNTVTVTPPPGVTDPVCAPDCAASASTDPVQPATPGLPSTGAAPPPGVPGPALAPLTAPWLAALGGLLLFLRRRRRSASRHTVSRATPSRLE